MPPLLSLPDFRQEASFDCGPAAAWSVIQYFGLDKKRSYRNLIPIFQCDEVSGTSPPNLIHGFRHFPTLQLVAGPMDLADLERLTGEGWPVLCCVQLDDADEGRWVAVRGVIKEHVAVQCPRDGRVESLADDWLLRWWDWDVSGRIWRQFGCAIRPR
jgi:hypothetical protein